MVSVAQTGVWDDLRRGTSLGSDIARLVGGGLYEIGGITRQVEKERLARADRLAERAQQESQFGRSLAQNDEHFKITRADKFAERGLDSFVEDEHGDFQPDPVKWDVPTLRATGAAVTTGAPSYEQYKKQQGLVCEAGST